MQPYNDHTKRTGACTIGLEGVHAWIAIMRFYYIPMRQHFRTQFPVTSQLKQTKEELFTT